MQILLEAERVKNTKRDNDRNSDDELFGASILLNFKGVINTAIKFLLIILCSSCCANHSLSALSIRAINNNQKQENFAF
jgi:hypothetical protein